MRIDRLIAYADTHTSEVPPLGYERKHVRYLLRIDMEGQNPSLLDLATEEDKRGKAMFVPTRGRPSGMFHSCSVIMPSISLVFLVQNQQIRPYSDTGRILNW